MLVKCWKSFIFIAVTFPLMKPTKLITSQLELQHKTKILISVVKKTLKLKQVHLLINSGCQDRI